MSAVQRDILLLQQLEGLPATGDTHNNHLVDVLRNVKLIVFDSVATILSPLLGLRLPPSWTGHVALDQISALLRWFAIETSAAVLITNRLVSTNSVPHPALGLKWTCFVDVSICLSRNDDPNLHNHSVHNVSPRTAPVLSVRVASKFDRSRSCRVQIAKDGLQDVGKS